jgi:hypothetical protein
LRIDSEVLRMKSSKSFDDWACFCSDFGGVSRGSFEEGESVKGGEGDRFLWYFIEQ